MQRGALYLESWQAVAVAPLSQQLVRRDTSELVGHAMVVASCAAELSELTPEMTAAAFSLVLIENGRNSYSLCERQFYESQHRDILLRLAALGVTFFF